jgi:hypothetical protein
MKSMARVCCSCSILLVLACVPASALSFADDPPVSLRVRSLPLRQALERICAGSGLRLVVAPELADAPVTADLRDVPRSVAIRAVLRLSGIGGGLAQFTPLEIIVSQVAAADPRITGGTITSPIEFAIGRIVGTTPGPQGIQVPNQQITAISTARRFPNGQPTLIGGFHTGTQSNTVIRPPFVPGGLILRQRRDSTSNTFVTITVLPDPLDDGWPRRRP